MSDEDIRREANRREHHEFVGRIRGLDGYYYSINHLQDGTSVCGGCGSALIVQEQEDPLQVEHADSPTQQSLTPILPPTFPPVPGS